jgi:hypothetical protein
VEIDSRYVAMHSPDFEYDNFSLSELLDTVLERDEDRRCGTSQIRAADWTKITNASDFMEQYNRLTENLEALKKGEAWGRGLAMYALDRPNRSDNGQERKMVRGDESGVPRPERRLRVPPKPL